MVTSPPKATPATLDAAQVTLILQVVKRIEARDERLERGVTKLNERVGRIEQSLENLDAVELAREQVRNQEARSKIERLERSNDERKAEIAQLRKEAAEDRKKAAEQSGGIKVISTLVLSGVATALSLLAFFLR